MKKKAIMMISCLLISWIVNAEDFYVLHIKGKISTNGQVLKLGDKITDHDKIRFVDANAIAVVMSSVRGRLKLANTSKTTKSELGLLVNDIVKTSKGKLSTRGTQEVFNLMDLKNHIKGDMYPVIDSRNLSLPPQLPVTDENYYFFRYTFQNKTISKPLKAMNEMILIDQTLYSGNDFKEVKDAKLYYYSAVNDQEVLIESFYPVFLKETEIKQELVNFHQLNNRFNKSAENSLKSSLKFLNEVYGNIDEKWFKQWYLINFPQ